MPRRVVLGLVALVAIGIGVRWAWVLGVDPTVPEQGDANAYHLLADGIVEGDGYVRPYDRVLFGELRATAEYPPLHPGVLAAARAVGIDSVQGQRLWLSVFGAAGAAATGLLAWRLTRRPGATLVAAGIVAVHPLLLQADATLLPEGLAATLGAVVVATAVDVARKPSARSLLLLGAACGLAALTRSEALLLLPFVAVPAALVGAGARPGGWWRLGVVPVVAFLVVVGPWWFRNHRTFSEFVPISTNVGSVLDGANCDATYGGPLLGYWSFSEACFEGFTQRELRYLNDESLVADDHRHQGTSYAFDHVGDWPKVVAARLGRTIAVFRPAQLADLGALEGRRQGADYAGYAVVWATLALAVVGARRLKAEGAPWWVPAAAVVVVWGSTALTYGNPRFLALAQPSLAALAAAGATRR